MLTSQVAPADVTMFQDAYLACLRTNMANSLKKRDKAKERRVDKVLAASRKKLEENDGKVKMGGASTYAATNSIRTRRWAAKAYARGEACACTASGACACEGSSYNCTGALCT